MRLEGSFIWCVCSCFVGLRVTALRVVVLCCVGGVQAPASAPSKAAASSVGGRRMAKLKNLRRPARPQDPPASSGQGTAAKGADKPAASGPPAFAAAKAPSPAVRPYALGDGLNVFIVSNDPRLAPHAAASPFGVIEYNGHDAFEFGAVGQVKHILH